MSDPAGGSEGARGPAGGLPENLSRAQAVLKPAAIGRHGAVATHHRLATEVGTDVLRRGGNAVDAAIAAAFALGVVEPWMSGLGGVGAMLVREARSGRVSVVDFGPRAPAGLDPGAYPLDEGVDKDLFGWPKVVGNRNLVGPLAVAVPSMVAGHALAHAGWGSRPWAELLMPAAEIAARGAEVDWHTTLLVATAFPDLSSDPGCAAHFCPGGAPPAPAASASVARPRLPWPALAATLRTLASAGPQAFYEGPIARAIAAEMGRLGGSLSPADLAGCGAARVEPARLAYRGYHIHVAPDLNGGPTLIEALSRLQDTWSADGKQPDGRAFAAYAGALRPAWARRLAEMGDAAPHPTSTTNLAVADRDGNLVVVTQTLLSLFGARLLLPETGLLMNNGINWFDPRPGRPNSLGPGKRALANYAPVIAVDPAGRDAVALGGAGGRKILPAVFNLLSFLIDHGLSLEEAMHAPRIDVSGPDFVVADSRLRPEDLEILAAAHPAVVAQRGVYPYHFSIASAVRRIEGRTEAAVEPWHPGAEAMAV